MTKQRSCIGFGETEGRCGKKFEVVRGAWWCPECDEARENHNTEHLEKMVAESRLFERKPRE